MKQASKNVSIVLPLAIGALVLVSAGGGVYSSIISSQELDLSIRNQSLLIEISNELKLMRSDIAAYKGSNGFGGNPDEIKIAVSQALTSMEEDKLSGQRKDLYQGWEPASINSKGNYVYGNPTARFTLVNYSDFECPFCKQFHQTPKFLVDSAKNGAVNWEWRHYPMSFHEPLASKAAMTTECVAQQKGPQGFWAAANYWFNNTEGNAKGFAAMDKIPALFELDTTKFNECMTDKDVIQRVKSNMQAGEADNITGTPTTIIVDNQTGKAVPIVGARPLSQFVEIIQEMAFPKETETQSNKGELSIP